MKKFLVLLSMAVLLSSCVTKRINSDGSIENTNVDNVKLSDTYVNLALEYQKHNAPQIALERANLAVETNSSNARAYMVRGIIYSTLNKPTDAEINLKKAISLQKNFSDAYVNYAVFLCGHDRYADALKNFDIALDNPLYYSPEIGYYNKGECYLKQNKFDLANQAFLQSLTYKTPPTDSYLSLARLQFTQQNYVLAKFYMDKFNGEQSAASLWLHIQIIQAVLDNNLAQQTIKENTSYRNTLAIVLMDNYGNSAEAQKCLMKYGKSVNQNNLIAQPATLSTLAKSTQSNAGINNSSVPPVSAVKPKTPSTTASMPVVANSVAQNNSTSTTPATNPTISSLSGKSDAVVANANVQTDASGRKYIIVPAGATMYAISRRFNITIQQIEKFNKIKVTQISKGMKLYIE